MDHGDTHLLEGTVDPLLARAWGLHEGVGDVYRVVEGEACRASDGTRSMSHPRSSAMRPRLAAAGGGSVPL